jgi:hypothetical protein
VAYYAVCILEILYDWLLIMIGQNRRRRFDRHHQNQNGAAPPPLFRCSVESSTDPSSHNPDGKLWEIQNFHFEVLHFSTSILGFLHFFQDFYAGFYKVVTKQEEKVEKRKFLSRLGRVISLHLPRMRKRWLILNNLILTWKPKGN